MPKPEHTHFCPHCGATPSQRRSSDTEAVFTCGERITRSDLTASYTCGKIGARTRRLEDMLSSALRCIPHLRLPVEAMQIMTVAVAAPDNGTFVVLEKISTRTLAYLVSLGMLDEGPGTRQIRATRWGREVYKHLEGMNHAE